MLTAVQRIRVEWGHCDPAKIIFNPNYYIWMDQGAHRLFEAAGFSMFDNAGKNGFIGCALVASGADFLAPAHLGDVLHLASHIERFGDTSFRVAHRFTRAGDELAKGFEVRVWGMEDPAVPGRLKATSMPSDLRHRLSQTGQVDVTV